MKIMFDWIVNSLHFFVMAVGVWTIVCAIYKMPWVFELLFKKSANESVNESVKKVTFDKWVACDFDGYVGAYSSKPVRGDLSDKEWYATTIDASICTAEVLPGLKGALGLTWDDEPVKVKFTIEVKESDLKKAKKGK